ncbi:hypothetical protein LO80_02415 [Candidatus Francisella endociliophora]|uniref:Uncharacterized protein n=1 Tax=Candidatus Francisella endociliophora TaxID=653937 RepID=A0A097EN06_9GAMM|nr:hypothetical protein [Francisella sp. FSC1006]AIT08947.1 hypothetical protein LO80_02415 [Francisella sp. FSC1006]
MWSKKGLFSIILFLLSINIYASESYVNFCKVYNPKKGIEYETHTKISLEFCKYYLKKCNEKYDNKCNVVMNAYQGLYNTNPTIAKMHVMYNDDFDRENN